MLCLFVSSYACWCSAGFKLGIVRFFCRRENEKLEKTDWPAVGGAYRDTVGGSDGGYGAILDWDLIVFWNCVGEEAGRAQRDGRVEGECCACLFLVMCVGKV